MSKQEIPIQASDVIRILRTAAGMSSKELAKQSGVSVSLISLIEKGERVPSMDLLKKISVVLHVPMSALVLLLGETALKSDDTRVNQIIETVRGIIAMEQRLRSIIKCNK